MRLPYDLVEAAFPAVKMVVVDVARKLVTHAVQLEAPAAYAVCATADQHAVVRMPGQIFVKRVEAQHHIPRLAVAVRRRKRPDQAAVVEYVDLYAHIVGQGILPDPLPAPRSAECLAA